MELEKVDKKGNTRKKSVGENKERDGRKRMNEEKKTE